MKTRTVVRWKLAWLLFLPITLLMSLDRTAMVVAAPIIQKDLGFSLQQMSWILTAFHWSYALLSIPAGMFAAYFGARIALVVANAAWSVLTLAIPFAPSVGALTGMRLLLGGFQAVDWPSSIASFKQWFPTAERSRANSALLAGVYLGPILGAPITALLVSDFGWRSAFLTFGLLGLVSAVLWWTFFRNTPDEHPGVSDDERAYIRKGMADERVHERKGSLAALVRRRAFWTIGLQGVCTGGVMGFFNTWLPTYLMQERGVALKSLGFFSSVPWMILLAVVCIASVAADHIYKRTGSEWAARVPSAVFGFLVSAVCLVLGVNMHEVPAALALLAVSLGGMGFVQVSTWSTIQHVGGDNTGILTAWNGMLTNGGAALGPVLMAMLVHRDGNWIVALSATAAIAIVGAFAWLLIYPMRANTRLAN
ncbi:MFS transporter [Paraburkholderia susongensis]|uniref:MFS transporter, ACS family, glucarate transporter n=1 Tax=Paraburkholderia susongensis TaxID=1515439 RepID=A0A1X7JZZ1_9BURK|nr:MFS transporter [Paraburkholderia susongensis]SMG34164.1 MFS transporter, ACS family, glucarate transporter [Paraburkholderia susongensis]